MIDYDLRQVFIKEEGIKSAQKEFNTVAFLAEGAGETLSWSAGIKVIRCAAANRQLHRLLYERLIIRYGCTLLFTPS